jgi:hypothetical protein
MTTGPNLKLQLPAVYVDTLDQATNALARSAPFDLRRLLVSYYAQRASRRRSPGAHLLGVHQQALEAFAQAEDDRRRWLALRLPAAAEAAMRTLQDETSMDAAAALKSLIYEMRAEVLEHPDPAVARALRRFAAHQR